MRPASLCRPGNRRPPCDQPYLADPAIAVHHATSPPCRPGNRRPPVMPPFSIQAQPLPHGAGGPHAKQTVVSRPRRPSTAKRGRGDSRKGPQLAGGGLRREGVAEGRGCRGKGLQREGVAEGRDYGREGCNRKARSRIRHGPAESPTEFFAGFVPFASLNIRFERVQTASQPYFYSRKRFTPRPHTHQIQPVAAPRQRSAPAGGSRDRHPLRLEDSLPFRPSVRHPETHGSGCRFVGS